MLFLHTKLLALGAIALLSAIATPALSIPTASPKPSPTALVDFSVKFQGIDAKEPDQKVDLTIKQNGELVNAFYSIPITTDANGIYSGTIENIIPGVYDVYIKNTGRLGIKVSDVNLAVGLNNEDWSNQILLAGDFNNDNKLNIQDIRLMLANYKDLSVPVSLDNSIYDVNADGVVDIKDIGLVLSNYTAFEILGE